MKKEYKHFDIQLGILHSGACYDTAAADKTHPIILLLFNIDVDNELKNYTSTFCQHALKKQQERLNEMEEL